MPKETTMCPNSELAIVTIKPEITTVKARNPYKEQLGFPTNFSSFLEQLLLKNFC